MSGLLGFTARFGTEDRCIEYLAGLRWPDGYVCGGCGGRGAWRLKERARTYECRGCGHQESVTAGTIFHRTRTDLPKWFLAAYLMGKDKRGVSAKFLQRELGVAYQTRGPSLTSCAMASAKILPGRSAATWKPMKPSSAAAAIQQARGVA